MINRIRNRFRYTDWVGVAAYAVIAAVVIALVLSVVALCFAPTSSVERFSGRVEYLDTETHVVGSGKTVTVTHSCDVVTSSEIDGSRSFEVSGSCPDSVHVGDRRDFTKSHRYFLWFTWDEYDFA